MGIISHETGLSRSRVPFVTDLIAWTWREFQTNGALSHGGSEEQVPE